LKARYYSPDLSRFLTKDSIDYSELEDPQSLNLYGYAKNNPITNIDPSGHFTISWSKFWVGFAIDAALAVTAAGMAIKTAFAMRKLASIGRVYIRENIEKAVRRTAFAAVASSIGMVINVIFAYTGSSIGQSVAYALDWLDGRVDGTIRYRL
jgi:hypothetical protein